MAGVMTSQPTFTVAKIAATPTLGAWAQAYNAGTLFAVIALTKETLEAATESTSLAAVGKTFINTLEAEYFSLEEKTLVTLKEGLTAALASLPTGITPSLAVATVVPNEEAAILYVFSKGGSTIRLKRNGQLKTVLTSDETTELKAGSGYLAEGDLVFLESHDFPTFITTQTLDQAMQESDPHTLVDVLMPHVHEKEGAAAALAVVYQGEQAQQEDDSIIPPAHDEKPQERMQEQNYNPPPHETEEETFFPQSHMQNYHATTAVSARPHLATVLNPAKLFVTSLFTQGEKQFSFLSGKVAHTTKLFFTIAIIVGIVLIASVYFALSKQEETKRKAEFTKIHEEAKQKYDEGQSLLALNKNLARDDFLAAQKILVAATHTFPSDSEEAQTLAALKEQVDTALEQTSGVNTVTATAVSDDQNPLLKAQKDNTNAVLTQTTTHVYLADSKSARSIAIDGGKETELFKNDWDKAAGIGLFGTNIYILDADGSQVLKFTPSGKNYNKGSYFSSDIDVTDAKDMAIDGSVWILINNDIRKYTKAKADTFTISGLDTPLANPKKIFTNEDTANLYILDSSNSRIVIVDKTGKYQTQVKADVIKNATAFDIREKDKHAYVLSKKTMYQLSLP